MPGRPRKADLAVPHRIRTRAGPNRSAAPDRAFSAFATTGFP